MSDVIAIIIKGGVIMIPLLLCSVIALAVTIERILYWRRIHSKQPVEQMLLAVEQGKLNEVLSQGEESPLPAARVLAAGLAHRNPSYSKAMEVAAQAEMPTLKRRLVILDTIITLAPFITLAPLLGLLGTITGMISSFGIMSDAGLGQPHAVTRGVAEALIATATGLLIAILALIPYNYFTTRAEKEMEEIEYYASRLELACSRNRRAASAPAEKRKSKKSPHRNHSDDRYDFFSSGLLHDFNPLDVAVYRHAGQSAQGRLRQPTADRGHRDFPHWG
jgi:biopolymer transport protein ExbB